MMNVTPMRIRPLLQSARSALLAGTFLAVAAPAMAAGPVKVDFEPPQIDAQPVCEIRAPDSVITTRWDGWDGQSLSGMDSTLVRRDMRRLMAIDPVKWLPVGEKVVALLPTIDATYDGDKQLMETIEMRLEAGQAADVRAEGLIDKALASTAAEQPQNQRRLGEWLMQGKGVAPDRDRGLQLIVAAARGGDANSLLSIASFQQRGIDVPNWNVEPKMTVMMGFASQVGRLDETICDRVVNIARAYRNGDIVQTDNELSERWFRFAADLGSPDAAWSVADMHLRSEEISKDNAVMLHYLGIAATGGDPSVLIQLGRLYEDGALLERDLGQAEELYQRAAASGDRAGMGRLTLFLDRLREGNPARTEDYDKALSALLESDNAPGWAYPKAADRVLAREGRWAGEQTAMDYYAKGVALGDPEAIRQRALLNIGLGDAESFYAGIDDLIFSVEQIGRSGPVNDLVQANLCKAPDAPLVDRVGYWQSLAGAETEAPDPSLGETLAQVKDGVAPTLPFHMMSTVLDHAQAVLPVDAAASDLIALASNEAISAEEQSYWSLIAARAEAVSPTDGKGWVDALGDNLALRFVDRFPQSKDAEAIALQLADQGYGRAMTLLTTIDPGTYPDPATIARTFAPVIDARGDFEASLLALRYSEGLSDDQKASLIRHARAATTCTFSEGLQMAEVLAEHGSPDQFAQWVRISKELVKTESAWSHTNLGDLIMAHADMLGDDAAGDARNLWLAGYEKGDRPAVFRLMTEVEQPETPDYDPAKAAEYYVALTERSAPDQLPSVLDKLANAQADIRQDVETRVDTGALWLAAAKAGSSEAMLHHARQLRASASNQADISESGEWLRRAADAGSAAAMVELARSLAFGIGADADPEAARDWLQKAAALGNEDAVSLMNSMQIAEVATQ
ncbi:tetratricopeptide repeat protein [Salipiger mangrovisoli]|uniref:Sel1 repeat family protein n=1 Tax=Salipiger mangrovisoli TaxID=2865933 RepID=A0ABR9X5I2_9RHOB|nr:SEL1-like repeat protein [Salipiger mangrovisoli]MBE9638811.1 sel1 repeat family protein [Salipiger mangrovisoli]